MWFRIRNRGKFKPHVHKATKKIDIKANIGEIGEEYPKRQEKDRASKSDIVQSGKEEAQRSQIRVLETS